VKFIDLLGLCPASDNEQIDETNSNLDYYVENDSSVKGQLLVGVNLNFVGMIGADVSIGLLFNLADSRKSGLFLSGGFAAGVSAGGSVGIASNADLSVSGGFSPIGIDAGFNISQQHMIVLPFATQEETNKLLERYYEHH